MKLFPMVFVGLLLARQQYRQTVVAVGVFMAATLAGLWLLCPEIAVSWKGTQDGLAMFRSEYMLGQMAVGFDTRSLHWERR